jgi:hypothetical protein
MSHVHFIRLSLEILLLLPVVSFLIVSRVVLPSAGPRSCRLLCHALSRFAPVYAVVIAGSFNQPAPCKICTWPSGTQQILAT